MVLVLEVDDLAGRVARETADFLLRVYRVTPHFETSDRAKGTVSVSKQQDRGSNVAASEAELTPEAIAAALAKMSKEEQTLTLIEASYATPIRIAGSAADQP